jgi:hypothetical protein
VPITARQAIDACHDYPIDIDPDTRTVRMDWHHYSLDQVDTWADRIVEAAWEHGFGYVEFVHGAPDIGTRGSFGRDDGQAGGRGTIKQLLRKRLFGNRWHRWAREMRAGMHSVEEGHMLIALRENPHPAKRAKWPLVPPPVHG